MDFKKWLGTWPARCDICGSSLKDVAVFFDAKTKQGPWGLLCRGCFTAHGVGLGTGKGQAYEATTKEKIEG